MSTPKRHSPGPSEVTLTPGIDGSSDYQQYLEKTSRKDSSVHTQRRGESSPMNSPSPPGITDIQRDGSFLTSRPPTADSDIQPAAPATSVFEEINPAGKSKGRKRRQHRVEAAEDPLEYPGPLALTILTIGICLSVFLVSLDRTIVATVSIARIQKPTNWHC